MRTSRVPLVCALAASFLVACGGDAPAPEAPIAIDPCTLLTRDEAEAATGLMLSEPVRDDIDGVSVACVMGDLNAGLVRVSVFEDTSTAEELRLTAFDPSFVVEGPWDMAVWSAAGRELTVLEGDVQFGIATTAHPEASDSAKAAAAAMAEIAVTRL